MSNYSSTELQSVSKQDFAFSGIAPTFTFVGVADGHGKVINAQYPTTILKNMELVKELDNPDFFEKILEKTNSVESNGVGSTLSICKIYEDRFEFYWIGDSTCKLYKEGKMIWKTKDHDMYNDSENERLEMNPDVNIITQKRGQQILDVIVKNKDTIQMVPAKLYKFKNKNVINFTNSLGHAGITGGSISKEVLPREEGVSYKVVCATDGLWLMTCEEDNIFIGNPKTTSQEIVDFANKRWRQSWIQEYNGEVIDAKVFFPETNIDDIGVSTWTTESYTK